ncbi:uncharacterized protein ACWYII_046273 [Salvelinus alpinus]
MMSSKEALSLKECLQQGHVCVFVRVPLLVFSMLYVWLKLDISRTTAAVLEDQLEDQRKPRKDEPPPSPGHLYVGSFSKATPSKCPRLYCSSSSTTQPQNQTT